MEVLRAALVIDRVAKGTTPRLFVRKVAWLANSSAGRAVASAWAICVVVALTPVAISAIDKEIGAATAPGDFIAPSTRDVAALVATV